MRNGVIIRGIIYGLLLVTVSWVNTWNIFVVDSRYIGEGLRFQTMTEAEKNKLQDLGGKQ